MPPRKYSTLRQKRLGRELRTLRERAGVSIESAAAVLECNKAKISRIETGLNGVRPYELRGLLAAYGVADPEFADVLVDMAKEGSARNWWDRYADLLPGFADLAHLESKAVSLHTWETVLVPDLLQTPDYMRALFGLGRFAASAPGIARSIEARLARQEVLGKPGAPTYRVILYESVLRAGVGGSEVMRGQLRHLARTAESGRATVQVMPYDAPPQGLDGPFTVFGMAVPGMDVVRAGGVVSPVYVEGDGDVRGYRALFEVMRTSALRPVPSHDRLEQAYRGSVESDGSRGSRVP